MRLSNSSPATSARRLVDRRGRLGTALFARRLVQAGFALTTVLVGVQFTRFVLAAQDARLPLPERPPGVEAFLPISGLMGLRDWFHQGELNSIHPAASIIVLLAIVVSWLLRKSFCSWICPIGLLSEALAALGRRIYGRNPRPWRALDVVLRSLKYVLLAFFLYAILTMHEIALRVFLESPYNRVADVKMGLFFVHAGTVTVVVMAILVLGSTLWSGTWCRYLCPYGALLGLFGRLSPTAVVRDASSCIDCRGCDRVCMAQLNVSKVDTVRSPECTGCLDCVAACPVDDCLQVQVARRPLRPLWVGLAVIVLFTGGVLLARTTGNWQNAMDDVEYVERIRAIDSPQYGHPGATGMPSQAREAVRSRGTR